jgi:GST-like protein
LYTVLNARLDGRDFIAGQNRGTYSIADMACWPWVSRFEWHEVDLNAFPNIMDWYLRIAARPAVQAGYSVPKFTTDVPML